MKKILFLFLFLILILITSCSSTQNKTILLKGRHSSSKDMRYSKNDMIEHFDVNQDGIADMWKIYQGEKISDKSYKFLSRREIDMNFDGKLNYIKFYNKKGNIIKEYLDRDLNGIFDVIRYYKNNVVVRVDEYKSNPLRKDSLELSGLPSYRSSYYSKGVLARVIFDLRNSNEKDLFYFYEKGKLEQIALDLDDDMKIDERIKNRK